MLVSRDEATASVWDLDRFFDKEADSPKIKAPERRVHLERGGDAYDARVADLVLAARWREAGGQGMGMFVCGFIVM